MCHSKNTPPSMQGEVCINRVTIFLLDFNMICGILTLNITYVCGGALGFCFAGSSADDRELISNPALSVDYVTAPPRMALYMEYSTRIYQIYLRYIAPEDIHVYSIDELFIDVTGYPSTYKLSAPELNTNRRSS